MDTYQPHTISQQERLRGTPLASFRRRAAAFVIDLIIVQLLVAATQVPAEFLKSANPRPAEISLEASGLLSLLATVLYFGLVTYVGRGRTLGKALLRIRVVSLVHERLSLWHAIERALGYAASSLEAGFGFLQYFKHPNRQTVHDRIAETIVALEPKRAPG